MSGMVVVGVDLGGTNMQVGVVRVSGELGAGGHVGGGEVVGRAKKKTKADKGAEGVLDRVAEGVLRAIEDAGLVVGDVAGFGIGAPGAVEPGSGLVLEAPNLRWRDVDVLGGLRARLGVGGGVAMVLENDVNVAVWGEFVGGAGRGASDVMGVWAGTGVGGGLVLNGSIYRGATGSAGEIGQTLLFPSAPLTFRKLEDVCSRTAVIRRVVHMVETNSTSVVVELAKEKGRELEEIGSGVVAEAYAQGDEVVVDVVNESADYLGRGVANMVTMLGLRRVVLGGGLTEALGDAFVRRVERSCKEHVFPAVGAELLEMRATELEDDAGLLGAAYLAGDAVVAARGAGVGVGAGSGTGLGAGEGGVGAGGDGGDGGRV